LFKGLGALSFFSFNQYMGPNNLPSMGRIWNVPIFLYFLNGRVGAPPPTPILVFLPAPDTLHSLDTRQLNPLTGKVPGHDRHSWAARSSPSFPSGFLPVTPPPLLLGEWAPPSFPSPFFFDHFEFFFHKTARTIVIPRAAP